MGIHGIVDDVCKSFSEVRWRDEGKHQLGHFTATLGFLLAVGRRMLRALHARVVADQVDRDAVVAHHEEFLKTLPGYKPRPRPKREKQKLKAILFDALIGAPGDGADD